jgi:TolA-binding protein
MTDCIGAPAELCALPYVEGTLPENEMERFEEHFFDCPVCLEHLRAIQAAGQALGRQPILVEDLRPKRVISWPVKAWALAAAAVLLLAAGAIAYRELQPRPASPESASATQPQAGSGADSQQSNGSRTGHAAPVKASQLADLALPAFVAPNLRGASEDLHYQAGMKAYAQGRCNVALVDLSEVPAQDASALAAKFYSGACQMHMGNLTGAAQTLHSVAARGDSPQQESALYYLAQISLARNDPAAAHRLLQKAIALQGDLEVRARAEDRKVVAMEGAK